MPTPWRWLVAAWVAWTLVAVPLVAFADDRTDALEAATAKRDAERLRAALLLQTVAEPGDEPVLDRLAEDPSLAVAAAAMLALSRLNTPDAISVLASHLLDPSAARREAAALGLIRGPLDLDPKLVEDARLQVLSPDAQPWLQGRDTYAAIVALRQQHSAELQEFAALPAALDTEARECVRTALRPRGILLETYADHSPTANGNQPNRADQFWREGRLSMLQGELERLQASVDTHTELADIVVGCNNGQPARSTDDVLIEDEVLLGTRPDAGPSEQRLTAVFSGSIGHDNNTFLMHPGLKVTEPGPTQGQPVDLTRDDTFGSLFGKVQWVDADTSWPKHHGIKNLGDLLLIEGWGGFDGRLRWGQLMGARGGAHMLYDTRISGDTQILRADVMGETQPADWFDEADLSRFPFRRAGGTASVRFFEVPSETRWRPAPDLFSVGYHGEGWAAIGDQGVEPPEDWFTLHRFDGHWRSKEGPGVGGTAEVRFGSNEQSGTTGAVFGRYAVAMSKWAMLQIDLGYGAGVPFGQADGTLVLGETDVDTRFEWQHGPLAAFRYKYLEHFDDELRAEIRLEADSRLRTGGRYSWAGQVTTGRFLVGFYDHFDNIIMELGLAADWGRFALGEALDEMGRSTGEQVDADVVSGFFWFEFPFWFEDWFSISLRSEGRLTSDTTRFEGRLEPQFRISLRLRVQFDMLDDY